MNIPVRGSRLVLLVALALLAGCIKPADQKAPENNPAPKAAEPFATAPAAPTQPPSVAGIPAAAIGAAQRAKARVEVASTATADNGALYKQAQTLFAEKKYNEALATLANIQAELMTSAQQKAVEELRAKIKGAQAGL